MTQEFILRSTRVLTSGSDVPTPASLWIRDGRIERILFKESDTPAGITVIDVTDKIVMPGIVDTHAHINEPGRTEWEGFQTATRAAAAGGITTVIDMPLNSIPATTTLSALKIKAASANQNCSIDYGFWGGVIPGNADELEPMVAAGVLGFKAFLCPSGVDEFPMSSESDLRKAMPILARLGVPLLVHAELESGLGRLHSSDPRTYQTYLNSRPPQWEVEAIKLVISLARETGCRTHIVHLSAADALPYLAQARVEGVPITAETCPHYLTFFSESIAEGATQFKCAPPIREKANREKLWGAIHKQEIEFIVSDHSPCTPALKLLETGSFPGAWGGISGLQFSLSVVWSEMRERGFSISDLSRLMSGNTARFLNIDSRKGSIAEGFDADLVVFDPDASFVLKQAEVLHRHSLTPYEGRKLFGKIEKTILRGRVIYDSGKFSGQPSGQYLQRDQPFRHPRNQERKPPHMNLPTHQERTHVPFTELIDLVSESVGGRALLANDEFFAEKENLLKSGDAEFIPGKYTEFGKWMDGWETRRKRGAGYDWCILKLGIPGKISGVNVDTAHFIGNFPEYCSIDACVAAADSTGDKLLGAAWTEILPKSKLQGGTTNLFPIVSSNRFTHLRLNIFPDGGVARLRVHGIAMPEWNLLKKSGQPIDLAAAENGGTVITCNDMFFGHKDNLLFPDRAKHMGEGWETRRKRGPGNDWIIIKLGVGGKMKKIEVDTNHFKGNYPDSCSIEGCMSPGVDFTAADFRDRPDMAWKEILPRTKLQAHHRHFFEAELKKDSLDKSFNYIRLNIFPDGGISRLRIFGIPE